MADDFVAANPVAAGKVGSADQFAAVFNNTVALRGRIPRAWRGLHLGTDRSGAGASAVNLFAADEIVMSDGARLTDWQNVGASLGASGAGGLDTGSEAATTWYDALAIAKSSDGSRALLLRKSPQYVLTESNSSVNATAGLNFDASSQRLSQGFYLDNQETLAYIDLQLARAGTPTGFVGLRIESNASGLPSGTVLAQADAVSAAFIPTTTGWVRFHFRGLPTLAAGPGTVYHLVLTATYATSSSNYVGLRTNSGAPYARGTLGTYNGSAWSTAAADAGFGVIVKRGPAAPVLPTGYDRYSSVLGSFFNDAAGNLLPMTQVGPNAEVQITQIASVTATVPTLMSAPQLPPYPVVASLMAAHSTAAAGWVQVASPHNVANDPGNGTRIAYPPFGGVAAMTEINGLAIEAQSMYAFVSGGTGTLFVRGWRF